MDINDVKKLIELFDKSDLNELEIEENDSRVRLRKGTVETAEMNPSLPPQLHSVVRPEPEVKELSSAFGSKIIPEGDNFIRVESPMVGTFYRAPSEGEEPYFKVGDMVQKGQVLCIIEAMKLMNEIQTEVSGKIVAILPENAQSVEYGEPLFVIET